MLFQKLFRKNMYKNAKLTEYSYHQGGDMIGSSYREAVRLNKDGSVSLKLERAETYDAPVEITEYSVKPEVLTELFRVFLQYRMDRWHNKRFTDEFVCDGETMGYSFAFDTAAEVRFSSQLFPAEYGDKLRALQRIIENAKEEGEMLSSSRRERS